MIRHLSPFAMTSSAQWKSPGKHTRTAEKHHELELPATVSPTPNINFRKNGGRRTKQYRRPLLAKKIDLCRRTCSSSTHLRAASTHVQVKCQKRTALRKQFAAPSSRFR